MELKTNNMKKLFTLLFIIAVFGCREEKKQSIDYVVSENGIIWAVSIDTSNRTLSMDLEEDVQLVEGKVSGIDISGYQVGDTLVLDIFNDGAMRAKRADERIEDLIYIGRVIEPDSGFITTFGTVTDSLNTWESWN